MEESKKEEYIKKMMEIENWSYGKAKKQFEDLPSFWVSYIDNRDKIKLRDLK